MKKVFISQPMDGKTNDEIFEERDIALLEIKQKINDDVKLIDSFCNEELTPLEYLAYSIKCLSKADIAYFAKGWQDNQRCLIEHRCAMQYDIYVILSEFDPHKTVIGRRLDKGFWD